MVIWRTSPEVSILQRCPSSFFQIRTLQRLLSLPPVERYIDHTGSQSIDSDRPRYTDHHLRDWVFLTKDTASLQDHCFKFVGVLLLEINEFVLDVSLSQASLCQSGFPDHLIGKVWRTLNLLKSPMTHRLRFWSRSVAKPLV